MVNLAKSAVETYIREGKIISLPQHLPQEFMNKKAGVFVSISSKNTKYNIQNTEYELRGCIGTYLPTRKNIAEEIIHNAIAVATEDYRFGPIRKEELPHLAYTVYILGEPEPVKDKSELNPKKFGIIVKTATKCGLLLPDLDGVDTTEKQVSIACQKGGFNTEKEKIVIYRFITEKYE